MHVWPGCSAEDAEEGHRGGPVKDYYVENSAGWFVIRTKNKKEAIRIGKEEFGSSLMRVRPATKSDVEHYEKLKGNLIEE